MDKVNGVLLVNKPLGMSSAAVLNKIKYVHKLDKIGHSGTLDPLASGVLVVLLGSATRLQFLFMGGNKEYRGRFKLGQVSTSDDLGGEVTATGIEVPLLTDSELQLLQEKFSGKLQQVPPQISAIKIGGERVYKLSRRGETVEISPREIVIDHISLKQIGDELEYVIRCSKGTYIRSIARDIGIELGCGALVSQLERSYTHPYAIDGCQSYDSVIDKSKELSFIGIETILSDRTKFTLDAGEIKKLISGDRSWCEGREAEKILVFSSEDDQFFAYAMFTDQQKWNLCVVRGV